jgi:hypothetical protein
MHLTASRWSEPVVLVAISPITSLSIKSRKVPVAVLESPQQIFFDSGCNVSVDDGKPK